MNSLEHNDRNQKIDKKTKQSAKQIARFWTVLTVIWLTFLHYHYISNIILISMRIKWHIDFLGIPRSDGGPGDKASVISEDLVH